MAKLSVIGPGQVGELSPGWSVTEQATAVAIGESSGSVGSATAAAGRKSTSDFVGGNRLELAHDDLGIWAGEVTEVDLDGLTASLTAAGVARALVATATAKPFAAGTPILTFAFPVADYGYPQGMAVDSLGNTYIYSQLPTTAPATSFITKWSADGEYLATITDSLPGLGGNNGETGSATTSTFFMTLDPTEQFIYFKRDSNNLIQKITIAGAYVTSFATGGSANGQIGFAGPGGIEVAANGNLFIADWANTRVMVLDPIGTYVTKWGTSGAAAGQFQASSLTDLALDSAGRVYTLEGKGGTLRVQIFTSTGTFVSLFNLPAALTSASSITVNPDGTEVYVQGKYLNGATFDPRIYVFDTSGNTLASWPGGGNLDPSLRTIGNGMHWKNGKLYYRTFSPGTEYTPRGGNRIVVAVPYPTLRSAIAYYMNFLVPSMALNYTATINPRIALPGWTGDVWAHIKDLCTAHGVELSVVAGALTVRDVGSATLAIAHNTRVKLKAASQGGSRALAIKYQNTLAGDNLTMWTADQILTVQILESKTVSYQTDSHPLALYTPTPTDALIASPGTYHVQDANGLDVPAILWTYWGGAVIPLIGDVPGQIRITVQGPRGIIPGYVAPFSLAQGSNNLRTPQLIVTGNGVVVAPQTVIVGTGADPDQATTAVGATIDNFAIATPAQMYSRGSWAQTLATGTDVEISFEMDVARLKGFGLDQGSIVPYNDSLYRITDIAYGNRRAQVTARRHVRFADQKSKFPVALLGTNRAVNPSFETSTNGFATRVASGGTFTPSLNATAPFVGTRVLRITSSGAGVVGGVAIDIGFCTVNAGESLYVTFRDRPNYAATTRARIYWYATPDGTGTPISSVDGADIVLTAGAFGIVPPITAVAPATTRSAVIALRTGAADVFTTGNIHDIDAVLATTDGSSTYFSGATTAPGEIYGWIGVPNASPSRRWQSDWTNALVKALWAGYANADVKVKPLRTV